MWGSSEGTPLTAKWGFFKVWNLGRDIEEEDDAIFRWRWWRWRWRRRSHVGYSVIHILSDKFFDFMTVMMMMMIDAQKSVFLFWINYINFLWGLFKLNLIPFWFDNFLSYIDIYCKKKNSFNLFFIRCKDVRR